MDDNKGILGWLSDVFQGAGILIIAAIIIAITLMTFVFWPLALITVILLFFRPKMEDPSQNTILIVIGNLWMHFIAMIMRLGIFGVCAFLGGLFFKFGLMGFSKFSSFESSGGNPLFFVENILLGAVALLGTLGGLFIICIFFYIIVLGVGSTWYNNGPIQGIKKALRGELFIEKSLTPEERESRAARRKRLASRLN